MANAENLPGITTVSGNYMPEDTNLLAKVYGVVKHKDWLLLEKYLWSYKDAATRETRAQEIVLAWWEAYCNAR